MAPVRVGFVSLILMASPVWSATAQDLPVDDVDACALLTRAEVGAVVGGEPTDGEGQSLAAFQQCDWTGIGEGGAYVGTFALRVQHNPLYTDSTDDLIEFLTWDDLTVAHAASGHDHAAAYATEVGNPSNVVLYALHVRGLILWAEVNAVDLSPDGEKFAELQALMSTAAERLSAL